MSWPPFHPEARQEFDNTLDELREIAKPLARRFPLHPFSYDLIYVPVEGDIFLVAFAHHKRRPGYWRKRIR